jgi:hypothetical protein
MKISKKIKGIITSFGILISISFIGSIGFYMMGYNIFGSFILLTIFQIILFSFLGSIIKTNTNKKLRELELKKLENLSTILECSYCNKKNLMSFIPDDTERIEFICEHCKKKNLVNIQFIVSQISEPLEIPKVIGIPSESE